MLSAIPLLLLAAAPQGTATVQLQDLLPLVSEAPPAPSAAPPVDALVVRSSLKGRLAPDALNVEGHFEVDVLAERWTRVPLLKVAPEVFVSELPSVANATVAVHDGALCLFTRTPGHYAVDVGLTVRADAARGVRHAQLAAASAGLSVPMHLEADPALFTVLEPGDGASEVYPREGRWALAWKTAAVESARPKSVVRPPLEPAVPKVTASWVSTLEGRASLRARYTLRLDRELPLEVELPAGARLERVVVNGVPVTADAKDGKLTVSVSPSSVGAADGTLELVLARELGVFHLSGQVELMLPRVSWPVAELEVDAHLPSVFNYRRLGGSLEQMEAPAGTGDGATLPGKALHFRQYLVAASAPNVELGYSVDMSKSYFH